MPAEHVSNLLALFPFNIFIEIYWRGFGRPLPCSYFSSHPVRASILGRRSANLISSALTRIIFMIHCHRPQWLNNKLLCNSTPGLCSLRPVHKMSERRATSIAFVLKADKLRWWDSLFYLPGLNELIQRQSNAPKNNMICASFRLAFCPGMQHLTRDFVGQEQRSGRRGLLSPSAANPDSPVSELFSLPDFPDPSS